MTLSLGIDIGNDKCVLAIARDGISDVLLNEESSRQTPSVVHFSDKQRLFGSSGAAYATTNPTSTITHLKRLVGRPFDDPQVQKDLHSLPFETSRGSDGEIIVKLRYRNEDRQFTAVAMLGMLFCHLKRTAELAAGSPISGCVIGVPAYFTNTQRTAYLDAAEIAGLKPLRLMHDGAATALEYGIYRAQSDEPTVVVVFIDIGQCDTQVTVVCCGCGGIVVLAHAFDPDLGGRDFDELLYRDLVTKFKNKHNVDVESNAKAKTRLRAACEKAKRVLSANAESDIGVESLMDGIDVNEVITRTEFESMCTGLLSRIKEVCIKALEDAQVSMKKIQSVEMVGSGSRIPAISKMLTEYFGRDLSRTLNGSECVARGCALQCAMLNRVCKVRDYEVTDIFPFPIVLSIDEKFPSESTEEMKGQTIPTNKMLILDQSNSSETLKIGVDYTNQRGISCEMVKALDRFDMGSFDVKKGCKVKVMLHINLNGIVCLESAPFAKDGINNQTSKVFPYSNPIHQKQEYIKCDLRKQERELAKMDEDYNKIKDARNDLEAYIFEIRKKLHESSQNSDVDESKMEILSLTLTEIEESLYEDWHDESVEEYSNKQATLEQLAESIRSPTTT